MSTVDSRGNVHHGAGTPGAGEFTRKPNPAPAGVLGAADDLPVYSLRVDGKVVAESDRVHPEWMDALVALRVVNPGAKVTLEAAHGGCVSSFDAPESGEVLVVEHRGTYVGVDEVHARGIDLTDAAVTVHTEQLLEFSGEGDVIDLDDVASALSEDPSEGPVRVEAHLDADDTNWVNVDINVSDNLLWASSDAEGRAARVAVLDEHRSIVESVYREWFNAELDVPESWDEVSTSLRVRVDRDHATPLLIIDRANAAYAKFRNETDPGTFGSPYVGAEIDRRIAEATGRPVHVTGRAEI